MGRAPSTVSREIGRNGGRDCYRVAASDRQAWRRALRPKACKLATHPQLRRVVARLLQRNWSPQQIAGWLRLNHPEDEAFWVSHETIYRSLFVQARGVLKKTLIEHLRTHRPIRRSRHATAKADLRGRIPDTVSISERPASVEDRAVPGHWEGDLLCGSANSYMVTLVERQTRYLMIAKIPSRDTHTVVKALIKQAKQLPRGTLQVANLGPRLRTRRPQALHDGNRHRSVLLRSAESLAAWLEREHQSLATTVFPQRHGSVGSQSGPIEPSGKRTQRTASQDARLRLASRTISSLCCVDRLKRRPPPAARAEILPESGAAPLDSVYRDAVQNRFHPRRTSRWAQKQLPPKCHFKRALWAIAGTSQTAPPLPHAARRCALLLRIFENPAPATTRWLCRRSVGN